MASRNKNILCLWVFLLACTLTSFATGRSVEYNLGDVQLRHRRSLQAANPQQISQCEWIAGEGCALHPSFVTYTLNRTNNDVVARYVTSALACAGVVEKGACEGVSYCYWDSAFTNGQQGCFLHDSAMMALQLQCIRPESRDSLSKLQGCMEARHSCQCTGGSASACQLRQQQLQAGYTSSNSKVCQSLLGCWLSKLNNSSPDIMQLVEVQLSVVQPKMEELKSGGKLAGGRKLQQSLSMGQPVLTDNIPDNTSTKPGYVFESGSVGGSTAQTNRSSSTSSPAVGMNDGIWTDDHAASPPPSSATVEYGKNISGPSSSGSDNFESGQVPQDGWDFEPGTVNPGDVYDSNSTTGGSNSGSGGGLDGAGGNAPADFWKCVSTAAIKADTTRKWADVDYNSKALTLATWIKVIQPTALIDWGVQVMECFKAEVTSLSANANSGRTKPNKESMEYAIVALIRVFSSEADTFRTYLQAENGARAAAGMAGLKRLSQQVLPDQYLNLQKKYNRATAYDRDVMLQAAAIIADMQWFAGDALALSASAAANAAQQQQVFEAAVSHGEEMMRRCLYWMFHVQFEGLPAHLPGVPITTSVSIAVLEAFDALAAAAFPATLVAAGAPAWQQLEGMTAVAVGWAANAASNANLNDAAQLGNALDALAKAHVQDFWGTRIELARAGAPDASRELALLDPSKQAAGWQQLRDQQVQLLMAVQKLVVLKAANKADAAVIQPLQQQLSKLVTATGSYLLGNSVSSQLADSLQYSSWLAALVRQCRGSPVGLGPFDSAAAAAAGVPATSAAACSLLATESNKMAAAAFAGAAPSEGVLSNLAGTISRQWTCAAQDPDKCRNVQGCQLALAGTLVPSSAAGITGSSSAAATAELLLQGSATSDLQLVCQADDSALLLSSYSNTTKAELAASPACEAFLEMSECESVKQVDTCESFSACQWERTSQRNIMHTVGNLSSFMTAANLSSLKQGSCSMNWMQVLSSGSSAAYSSLQSMINLCSEISDTAACTAQTMIITMDTSASSGNNMARIWVPALVVAAVLGLVLFAGVMYWRRRSTIARRAAEEARAAGGGAGGRASGKKGKDGKDGKAKNKTIKKKVKRAEPGSYKPDLMRDSFTDYMRSAPQQFENGVAIAKAAMAAGSLHAAVGAADVAGARHVALTAAVTGQAMAYPPQQVQQEAMQQQATIQGMSFGRKHAGSSALPPLPSAAAHSGPALSSTALATATTNDLIDLQTDVGAPAVQQQQQGPYPMSSVMYSGSVWGAAPTVAGANNRISNAGISAGLSGGLLSGGLSSGMDLIDAGASLALTSSLGLVSSLPQQGSVALNVADAQQFMTGGAGGQQEDVVLGLPGAASARSRSSAGRSGFVIGTAPVEGANSGTLLLGTRASDDIENGSMTPTSSCCHDSVCTFRHAGSTVSAVSSTVGARSVGAGSSSSWRSSAMRSGGSSGRAVSSSGAAGAGQGLGSALSGALSGALSRSSWSSAMSTDILLSSQHSAAVDQ